MTESDLDRTRLTARDFDELFESVRTWGTSVVSMSGGLCIT